MIESADRRRALFHNLFFSHVPNVLSTLTQRARTKKGARYSFPGLRLDLFTLVRHDAAGAGKDCSEPLSVRVERAFRVFTFLAVATAIANNVSAQTTPIRSARPERDPAAFLNQQRAEEERIRSQIDEQLGESAKTAFDWGGWYNLSVFVFDDGVESSRTFRRHDLRLWARTSLENGAHEFYARVLTSLLDFNHGDSYDGNEDDIEGPNLERGYYRFDLAKAYAAQGRAAPQVNLITTVGRDLVRWGNGVALYTPLDHVSLAGIYKNFELTGLAGKSVGSTQDIDLSRTAARSHRDFFGGQLKYRGFERHEPFLYTVWQHDRNHEAVYQPLQNYDYDSFYAGIGSIGELANRLRYETELVFESGSSYGDRRFLRTNDISAWAYQAQLEYLFAGKYKPRASIEYIFGSGDADRIGSPTNTVGGNRNDFDDTSFVGFGYRNTGLAFAPRYSNLHMLRAGSSFFPCPDHRYLSQMELGTDWFLFHKHHENAAVSDPTATVQDGYLGWEMDYFANWQVTADLTWTARFGLFFPGDSFDDESMRPFFLVGLTYSF